jgi:flavin-dependent dehydrogenase
VLVIGLGPAGSRAAAAAAKVGLHVIALEKRADAGTPVQCAEFVPSMIERDVPTVGDVTEQMIARMLSFVGNDTKPDETLEFRGRMINRAGFDRMLASCAVQSGTMAGKAAADFIDGRAGALAHYEEELGEIFDAALNRALRRCHELLACYEDGGKPNARALVEGWIGSPRYWRPERYEEIEERTP